MIECSIEEGVAVVRMNDEPSRNGLTPRMVEGLESAMEEAARSPSVRAVILAGREDYFSSGASLEVLESLFDGSLEPADLLLPRTILDSPKPVIAAMEGHAVGGGLALGLCADVVILARESRYGANFMNYGFTPGMGITGLLEYAVGPLLAHELLLTGEFVKGSRFESAGGVNAVLPRDEVMPRAVDVAQRIAEKPVAATAALKTMLSSRRRSLFESARSAEIVMHQLTFREDVVGEAIRSARRTPDLITNAGTRRSDD